MGNLKDADAWVPSPKIVPQLIWVWPGQWDFPSSPGVWAPARLRIMAPAAFFLLRITWKFMNYTEYQAYPMDFIQGSPLRWALPTYNLTHPPLQVTFIREFGEAQKMAHSCPECNEVHYCQLTFISATLFSSHFQVPFPQWMQTWGVLRCNLGSRGGSERGGQHGIIVQSWVTAFGKRGTSWQAFLSALWLQTMSHSWCQLWRAPCVPVMLSNTLVAILCQVPCPTFC